MLPLRQLRSPLKPPSFTPTKQNPTDPIITSILKPRMAFCASICVLQVVESLLQASFPVGDGTFRSQKIFFSMAKKQSRCLRWILIVIGAGRILGWNPEGPFFIHCCLKVSFFRLGRFL
ncbi:hypothetical protein AVEN_92278-1 [Araneus ventricosus]|uniref:Uncharacterized protein n=1 Tax=Araneus ventricosus TaxID=182803 RepID=A0A4Y2AM92_ARAVE|nr:hypothetical protein AVEN_92278-1 [Araneus ventricosus]